MNDLRPAKCRDTRVVAIIQARMGSSRLPGKVLEDLAGQPMLARVINRTSRADTIDEVIVATTTRPEDNVIELMCRARGNHYFRGSSDDVLDRYYQTAVAFGADAVVRITSDCPLIEPDIIDRIVKGFLNCSGADYVSNTLERTYPRGLDVEVFGFAVLKQAWEEDDNPVWREHVTPYIQRHPGKFRVFNAASEVDYSHMRWTVDTNEDLEFVRRIYNYFQTDSFHWEDVLGLLRSKPDLLDINRSVQQKVVL
jgi:spore coat polysaccharide biosynthesis protein SpsF